MAIQVIRGAVSLPATPAKELLTLCPGWKAYGPCGATAGGRTFVKNMCIAIYTLMFAPGGGASNFVPCVEGHEPCGNPREGASEVVPPEGPRNLWQSGPSWVL